MFRRDFLSHLAVGVAAVGLLATSLVAPASAEYPEKPITLVVGFSAGGGTDTYARSFANAVQESLGVPMVVVNKPGAAGMIAAKFVADQPADGYTLYMASAGSLLVKYMYEPAESPVDPLKDMRILGAIGASIPGLLVPENSDFKDPAALVQFGKANPGKLRWSHPGRGSLFQLTGEAFLKSNGVEAQDVPFKGGSKARNAVAGSQVDFGFMGVQLAQGFEGQVRAIGVSGDERDNANPDVPTFQESDLPIVKLTNPQMVMGPAGMPEEAAKKISEALKTAVETDGYSSVLNKAGLSTMYMAPEDARASLEELQTTLEPIIADTRG